MNGWRRYLELTAKSKTGLSSGVIVWAVLAILFGAVTATFGIFSLFIYLANRYDPLTAALVLFSVFLLLTIIVLSSCLLLRRRTVELAKIELAERKSHPLFDPGMLGIGLQIARTVGWRKLMPLAAAAVLAAGVAREWFTRDGAQNNDET